MISLKGLVAATFLLAYAEAFSETFVSLKAPQYSNKIVTSSTLRWITSEKGSRPETAVVGTFERFINESARVNPFKHGEDSDNSIVERNVYICRASHSGIWIPGQLRLGRQACVISLHDNIYTYKKYEVLDNTDGGARLSWARWDRYNEVPVGAVSGGDTFVARRLAKQDNDMSLGMKHLIGKLDEKNGFGKLTVITEDEKEEEADDGEVLIETEPIRYELTGIKFNKAKEVVNREPVVLGEVVLSNNLNTSGHIDTLISYYINSTTYWGQVKAMLKGLKTVIRHTHSNLLEEIEWGITTRDFNERLEKVDAFLEPNTAVNITLKGNHTDIETPYTARLTAVYSDGGNRAREIRGVKSEVQLQDVRPEYGPVYFTGNYSLVPTTTTTTTTTTSTTTKTTTQEVIESSTKNVINKNINTNIISKDDGADKTNTMNHHDSQQGKSNEKAASTQESNNANQINNPCLLLTILFIIFCRIL